MEPASVGQSRLDHRRGPVDAQAERCYLPLDEIDDGFSAPETRRDALEPPPAIYPHIRRAIHEDVADRWVIEE